MGKKFKLIVAKRLRLYLVGLFRTRLSHIHNCWIIWFLFCWVSATGLFGCAALKEVREMENVTGPCKVACNEAACKHAECLGFAASGQGGGCSYTRAKYATCMKRCTQLAGRWEVATGKDKGAVFVFLKSGYADIIRSGKSIKEDIPKEAGDLRYSANTSKYPHELDINVVSNNGRMYIALKGIFEFIDNNQIRFRSFVNEERPSGFVSNEDYNTLILKRLPKNSE